MKKRFLNREHLAFSHVCVVLYDPQILVSMIMVRDGHGEKKAQVKILGDYS